MKIDSYSFGKIVINGTPFTSDVIIFPGRIDGSWWRKQGHLLHIEDLTEALAANPEVLIVGTGYSGIMRVPKDTIAAIEGRGIEVRVERTTKAVQEYNALQRTRIVIAALHLTC